MQFKTLVVIASFIAASVAQTFSMFEDSIMMKVAPALTNVNAAIHDFPMGGDGTVENAMAIHNSVMILIEAVNETTDIMNKMTSKISDDEGMKMMSDLEGMKPMFMTSMKDMVAREPSLKALPRGGVPSLIEKDLEDLKTSAEAFIVAFNGHLSPEMVKEAEDLEDMGLSTISKVMKMYE